ncbi:hypothetical protein A1O3_09008 [Capronia epimyces CBS 606.96]|uniref:Endoplasmic reticulum lectin n=1 Tax=Capronia epimyces CBS 606.96 TaxID=1182542 RepID=W9Y617_9EURO|nr:uncharacterized protein A1O3_09008 [Capronia epimyces CBS 606.96]EXJ77849.1 hypothetical protein A1O3_09008 [Capronia epimyces CBS 606.96]
MLGMKSLWIFSAALSLTCCLASESVFSVNDDVFAFPQYGIEFLDSYVLESEALAYLPSKQKVPVQRSNHAPVQSSDVSPHLDHPESDGDSPETGADSPGTYELILLHGYPHLCFIPEAKVSKRNDTAPEPSATDREKELDRAVSRASELLQGMASNQCLYYSTGWWTYSFCHDAQVTQFHALPPGTNGRVWPPQEDPTTPSYVLGKFNHPGSKGSSPRAKPDRSPSTEVRSKAETNYLVQQLEGGTPCDLTGIDRKVEIQFHCNPQLTDRIGWIKETATCSYLMIIYTPRLCNDVTFQPPKESRVHSLKCREIISEDDVPLWEARHEEGNSRPTLDQGQTQQVFLGNVELGGMRYLGRDGKKLEKGRIVLTQDEKAETVIMQKNGHISSLSKAELKKLDLSQEDVDAFRKELQKLAGAKDWKIERLDDVNGHVQLRGVVSADDAAEEEKEIQEASSEDDPEVPGSQEEYVEEV